MISGSKIHTAVECPASEELPAVERQYDPAPAERGKVIHRYLERALAVGPVEAAAEAPEKFRPLLESIDFDEIPKGLATEVAFAWDWRARKGRELGRNIDRRYVEAGLDPTREIPLTMDLVGVDAPRWVFVRDWKSGHVRLPRPGAYGQTLLGGLCAASAYGADMARLELTYIDDDGDFWTARDDVDGWDLETYGDRVAAFMESLPALRALVAGGGTPDVREGPWCDYCPAYKACPAKTALVRHMPGMVETVGAPGYLAPDRIVDTFLKIEGIREILGRVEGEIFGLAAFAPLHLPDGRIIGPKTTVRTGYTGKVAADVLRDLFGADAAAEAVEVSVSKDALRAAISKRKKPKEKLSTKAGNGLIDRAEAEIRARNGWEMTRKTSVKVYRPRGKSAE